MSARLFDHIDLRVKNLNAGAKFYAKFLPQLGFAHEKHEPAPAGSGLPDNYTFYSAGSGKPAEFFGLTEDKNHRPNDSRIAFWAENRQKVDEIAKLVREAGGKNLEGPEVVPEYSAGYYAFFFEDPDGNKLEICCRESPIVAG
jgi:catechol 2,3-dioxygenase-like lactoylglutathione lyase family enzyme